MVCKVLFPRGKKQSVVPRSGDMKRGFYQGDKSFTDHAVL